MSNKAKITKVGEVVDGLPIGWVFDFSDCPNLSTITTANDGTTLLSGYSIEELERISLEKNLQYRDKSGTIIKSGMILSEDGGLVQGVITFSRGAFRVKLKYKGNKENKIGWGAKQHNTPLGEYLVEDRIRDYDAVVLPAPDKKKR